MPSIEEALKAIGVELPGGWHDWDGRQQSRFLENQKRLIIKRKRIIKLVQQRASRETFRGGPLEFTPREGMDPESPTFLVRGVYGPLAGLARSLIVVKLQDGKSKNGVDFVRPGFAKNELTIFEEDRIVQSVGDNPRHPWGPREFLYNLLKLAAQYGADCEIYLVHNKLEVGLDAEAFREWIEQANKRPLDALLSQTPLLEQKKT